MIRSLTAVLDQRAAEEPDRIGYRFLDEHGGEIETLTYGMLRTRALTTAAHLRERCGAGDRALLLFPPGLDFLVAYLGCLYAGVIAVPVKPPGRSGRPDAFGGIVADCAPAVVLTTSALAPLVPEGPIAVDALAAAAFTPIAATAETVAFLQYTSGSTATPKGVVVTHGNLAANEEMIRRAFGHDRDSTVVGWAPFFHDQGLIGNLLQPLWVGASAILMAPTTFIRRPLLWLDAISRYRAHTSGGPNFAYDACVRQAASSGLPDEWDLSCWKVAFNGAEPIRPETLHRFAARFAPAGFDPAALYPCYGLAEATLLVTGSGKGRGPHTVRSGLGAPDGRWRVLAGSGAVLPGEDVRIVDPDTARPCPPGTIGEVWVAGDHVATGYWQRPDATTAAFGGRLDGVDRPYLRTGDLGFFDDGELYVVGRIKDLIIVRGRNYYPQDLEHTVQTAHPALLQPGACAAFAVRIENGPERLVVVQEVRREYAHEADPRVQATVIAAIRAAVIGEHDVALDDLVLALPGQVRRTTSGKIMRAAARRRYQQVGFEVWTAIAQMPA